jgi:hypothetical protein
MRALKLILAGGVAVAALVSAAPAAAQYYPGYPGHGYGNGYGGNVVGQVINQVLGGGYGNYGGYGNNSQAAVGQCTSAVQARLGGNYGAGYGNPYGGYGNYGYNGGARVLGVSRVEPRSNGGLTVRGVASSGAYGGYNNGGVDLTWKCKVDYRGFVSDIDIDRANGAYGSYGSNYNQQYNPQYNPYAQYGYRRY